VNNHKSSGVSKTVIFETAIDSVRSLHHTFGTPSVKHGTELLVAQAVLVHASPKTTSIYVELARGDLDRQLQKHAL
jgi:site-specific recombinase XerD